VQHVLVRFLAVYLIGWVPLGFIGELLVTVPSIDMRGVPSVVELGAHGLVAMLSFTAGWMLWSGAPAALPLAAVAAVATGMVSVQSVYWTVLPTNIAPGEELPLTVLAFGRTAVWLVIIRAAHRRAFKTSSAPACR
jgi:hypothetical protein